METSDKDYKKENYSENFSDNLKEHIRNRMNRTSNSGRVLAGLIIVLVGSIYLAKQMGVYFPQWFFSWPMILIGFGVFIGAKHSFRTGGWIGLILVGGVFLIDQLDPALAFHQYIWPVVIIAVGVLMILRPRRKKNDFFGQSWENTMGSSSRNTSAADDIIDSVSIFGGNKKNIITKDFKGGDIVTFFGGMELNLSQADIIGPVVLEVTNFFGGTKLVLPANWRIKSELVTIFGNFEDKRPLPKDMPDSDKVLIIKGTCVFGGIDIKSF
jgi:hypothetical protein